MRTVRLPCGERVPAFGQGTWHMADDSRKRADEVRALQAGIDRGATLIDTAEMYGDGKAEQLIAEAIRGRRDEVFIVSKVYPHNASRRGAVAACERSLKRLKTDRIDLYLLHWRGNTALAETMEAFATLKAGGKIRHYGVSNLDTADMEELWETEAGHAVQTNQVLYNLSRRGVEHTLLPWLERRRIPVMAYSPIEQARLTRDPKLTAFAQAYDMTPAQAALAWLLRRDDVIVIPKTASVERLNDNLGALDIRLTAAQLAELDAAFPPPAGPRPLEML